MPKTSIYVSILEAIFFEKYSDGDTEVFFEREDIPRTAERLGIDVPKNFGDVIYRFKFRGRLPTAIRETATDDLEWTIRGEATSQYKFKLARVNLIEPRSDAFAIKIPDSTPEIIRKYALNDEQALLAKVRYNRLVDIFLGITTYSLQNHLRSRVDPMGQIEIDEIYVGVDNNGRQFIIPVQAKGGKDKHAAIQTEQDILFCRQKYPDLECRAVSAQFMGDKIAMFELTLDSEEIKVVREKHYVLVSADEITPDLLSRHRNL